MTWRRPQHQRSIGRSDRNRYRYAMPPLPPVFASLAMRGRIVLIAESYTRLTGRQLVASDTAESLWHAPRVIVAHDTATDPIFFFGNAAALDRFDVTLEALLAMPSRLSAEPGLREARQSALDKVAREGFVDGYAGVRISASGRRFRIEGATIWNLIDANGAAHGQAATFEHWVDL
jgi:hypothetical protein